jgi:hypothetical protein
VGDIDNPFVIQLQNGHVLCAFRNHSKNHDGSYLHHRITVCISEDGGKGWKYLSTPEEVYPYSPPSISPSNQNIQSADPVKGLWEPFMRIAKDGSLQLYYSRENAGNDQDSIQRESHEGGATWGPVIPFSGHGILARDGMLGICEFGQELVAVFETNEGNSPMHIKSVTSPGNYLLFLHISSRALISFQMMAKHGTTASSYTAPPKALLQLLKSAIAVAFSSSPSRRMKMDAVLASRPLLEGRDTGRARCWLDQDPEKARKKVSGVGS